MFVDERASDEQSQAMLDAYDGKLGGPLADLAGLIGEMLGVERAPITHEVHDGKGRSRSATSCTPRCTRTRRPTGRRPRCGTRCSRRFPGSPAYVAGVEEHGEPAPVRDGVVVRGSQRDPVRLPDHVRGNGMMRGRRARSRPRHAGCRPPILGGDRGRVGAGGGRAEISGRGGAAAPRRADRGRLPLRARARAVPRRLAGDDRGDDAAVDACRWCGCSARPRPAQPRPRAAMAAFLGGYALVWTAVRVARVRRRHGGPRTVDRTPWLTAPRVADRRRPSWRSPARSSSAAEGPLPDGVPAPGRVPAAPLRSAATAAAFALGRAARRCSASAAAGR